MMMVNDENNNPAARRQYSLRSSPFVGVAPFRYCLCHLFVFSVIWTVIAAASNVSSHDHQRDLSNIPGTTTCAKCSPEDCVSTTVSNTACSPCANGQTWWPCDLPGECYCKDKSAATINVVQVRQGTQMGSDACSTAACTSVGGKCVTASSNVANEYCSDCADGKQSWWPCNVMGACVCKFTEPPSLAPSMTPEPSSPATEQPTTSFPTMFKRPTFRPTEANEKVIPSTQMLEGMLVLDAHITANKITLARELFLSPMNGANANSYTFMGFKESLQQMIMKPILVEGKDPQTQEDIQVPLLFYIGDIKTTTASSEPNNERVYGLVNVALFLASSYSDSLSNGSCDEINSDIVNGFLPISNACGQHGMSYQGSAANSTVIGEGNLSSLGSAANSETKIREGNPSSQFCARGDQKYACAVDIDMRTRAKPPSVISSRSGGNAAPPGPFYCGPKIDYKGNTGHWNFEENKEIFQSAKKNRLGRSDVQG
jgi:hypothetical protein